MALGTGLVVGAAPPERAGAASAISETGAELGGALGIATLGSVATAVYGGYMAGHLPTGLPADLAGPAGETLPAALEAARGLGGELGTALADTARAAFTRSLHVHALILIPLLLALSARTPSRCAGAGSGTRRTCRPPTTAPPPPRRPPTERSPRS
ncbi:hypothetical protein STANM309S_00366 [Streptomyces tanashiensis]